MEITVYYQEPRCIIDRISLSVYSNTYIYEVSSLIRITGPARFNIRVGFARY
jgi:hypothetical protein